MRLVSCATSDYAILILCDCSKLWTRSLHDTWRVSRALTFCLSELLLAHIWTYTHYRIVARLRSILWRFHCVNTRCTKKTIRTTQCNKRIFRPTKKINLFNCVRELQRLILPIFVDSNKFYSLSTPVLFSLLRIVATFYTKLSNNNIILSRLAHANKTTFTKSLLQLIII